LSLEVLAEHRRIAAGLEVDDKGTHIELDRPGGASVILA
jgi:hypothetical protein